jgi:hypothetical protein
MRRGRLKIMTNNPPTVAMTHWSTMSSMDVRYTRASRHATSALLHHRSNCHNGRRWGHRFIRRFFATVYGRSPTNDNNSHLRARHLLKVDRGSHLRAQVRLLPLKSWSENGHAKTKHSKSTTRAIPRARLLHNTPPARRLNPNRLRPNAGIIATTASIRNCDKGR